MRNLTLLCLAVCLPAAAPGHELPAGAGHAAQLTHQLFSLHHWPMLLLLAVAVLVLLRRFGAWFTKWRKAHP